MKRRLLVIITSDPCRTHRVAEAVRVAAGLCGWERVEVTVCFAGAAAQVAGPPQGQWVEEADLLRYLGVLREARAALWVEQDTPRGPRAETQDVPPGDQPCQPIPVSALARLAADSHAVLRF